MSGAPAQSARQGLVAAWLSQMIGTIVLAAVVLYFARSMGGAFSGADPDWVRYARMGLILGVAPALLYLRTFKPLLDAHVAAERKRGGAADPALRAALMRSLAIGGALCEIPMAMGVVQLLLGGDTRWFLGATLVTIALRLSYRPFTRS